MDEKELIERILGRDRGAEEKLFLRYRSLIESKVRAAIGDADYQDVTNLICLAVLRNLREGRFNGRSTLGTYIYQITQNKISDYFRNRKLEAEPLPESLLNGRPTPEQQMELKERTERLKSGIRKLPRKYREVLFLYYYQGLSVKATARKLHVPTQKVSDLKRYALKKLKIIMENIS